jgi:hypothetical protein
MRPVDLDKKHAMVREFLAMDTPFSFSETTHRHGALFVSTASLIRPRA